MWQRTTDLDDLLDPAPPAPGSSYGQQTLSVNDQLRPVIAISRTLVQQHVDITAPGKRAFRIPDIRERWPPTSERWGGMPATTAWLSDGHGSSTSREATLRYDPQSLIAVVDFVPADVGRIGDVTVTTRAAWPPLQAESSTFVVPHQAHLRFGLGLHVPDAPYIPAAAHFRIALDGPRGAESVLHESELRRREDNADVGWNDVDVDLSAYAGQSVRLSFQSRLDAAALPVPFALPLPLISEPMLVVPAARGRPRNLVLVSIDTLRADHLGSFGYARPTSPTIDHLAAGGTTFENAFAVWPETSASHMTMFTSLYPSVHGIGVTKWGPRSLPPWQLTIAEMLRARGYVTGAITEDGLLLCTLGFGRGFTTYHEYRDPQAWVSSLGVADKVFGEAAQWVRQHQRDAFFLFLHTYQVHQYAAPGPQYDALRTRFQHDSVPAPDAKGAELMVRYDAAIRYTDDALANFVRTLDELHLTDQTLLIVTSDHGEEFGTHHEYGHGANLSDFNLHVPLVLRAPGLIPAGRRIAEQISLIDLVPTVLDLLHLPSLEQCQGRSFAAAARGDGAAPSEPLFAELGDDQRAVRHPHYKVITHRAPADAPFEYYDLQRDPGETENRPGDQQPTSSADRVLLQEHDLGCVAQRMRLASTASGAVVTAAVTLDPTTLEHLRALGYTLAP